MLGRESPPKTRGGTKSSKPWKSYRHEEHQERQRRKFGNGMQCSGKIIEGKIILADEFSNGWKNVDAVSLPRFQPWNFLTAKDRKERRNSEPWRFFHHGPPKAEAGAMRQQ
jgi:hypothetical protein